MRLDRRLLVASLGPRFATAVQESRGHQGESIEARLFDATDALRAHMLAGALRTLREPRFRDRSEAIEQAAELGISIENGQGGATLHIRAKGTSASHHFLERQVLGGGVLKLPEDAERRPDSDGRLGEIRITATSAEGLLEKVGAMVPELAQQAPGKWTTANPPGRTRPDRSYD